MIQFINIKNGTVYSGVSPYIHWFDEGQSVNINYYKEIVFLSDSQNVTVTIEKNPYFKLMDFMNSQVQSDSYTHENINGFDYYHIENFLTDTLSLSGIRFNGKYLYRFFVYAFSQDVGEYIADIDIDGEKIHIGADFYPENELLTNDLENLGIEIPMQIQKAIYESNVHEEAMDNILINRKWKELLLEYWNIVACKGNYTSLINSMKFFEYGDLLKIMEFWKAHYNKDIFISNDLEQILNDRFREQLSVLSKTTYIGLYLAMDRYTKNPDGTVPMEDDSGTGSDIWAQNNPKLYSIFDADPELGQISSIWSAIDLSLKMTLVGNFFATYFMPLHLDLIHSTIENVVFTNTVKLMSNANFYQRDFVDLCGWFHTSVKRGQNYYIMPQDVYVTPRTILGYKEIINSEDGYPIMRNAIDVTKYTKGVKFLGVDTTLDTSYFNGSGSGSGNGNLSDIIFSAQNMIHMFGALVPIDVKIVSNVRSDDALKSAQINWVKDNNEIFSYCDNGIWIEALPMQDSGSGSGSGNDGYIFDFNFNLLFTDPGTYHFFVTFTSTNSFVYAQEFLVNILDNADNPIHIYKVERIDPKEYEDFEIEADLSINNSSNSFKIIGKEREYQLNEFMLSQRDGIGEKRHNWAATQYICADLKNMQKNTGLNHVIMFTTQGNSPDAAVGGISANGTHSSDFAEFTDYWWFDIYTYTQDWNTVDGDLVHTGELKDAQNIVVGIRKYYTVNNEYTTLYRQTFKRGSDNATVTIDQYNSILTVTIMYTNGGKNCIYATELSDYVEFEVFGHKEKVRVYPDYNFYVLDKDSGSGSEDGLCKGHVDTKLKCTGRFYQLVDEDRFIPLLHKLTKVTEENCEVLPSELMVAIPELKRTYTDATEIVWEFLNSSTMESVKERTVFRNKFGSNYVNIFKYKDSIDFFEPFIGKFKPRKLTPGYYNINLNYKYAGEQHKESRNAAFKIRKK